MALHDLVATHRQVRAIAHLDGVAVVRDQVVRDHIPAAVGNRDSDPIVRQVAVGHVHPGFGVVRVPELDPEAIARHVVSRHGDVARELE